MQTDAISVICFFRWGKKKKNNNNNNNNNIHNNKHEQEGAGCSFEAGFKDARTFKGVSEWAIFG